MDIRELKLFLKLAQTLHYTKTSQLMAISPSALSRTIQRMEDEVGDKLFLRDNRGVLLTAAGFRFKTYAQSVIDEWNTLQSDLDKKDKSVKGSLSIYSSVTGCYTILPDLLQKCSYLFPDIHIKLKTGSPSRAIDMVLNGDVDIAVAAEPDHLPEGLRFIQVTTTPLQLIAPTIDCPVNRKLDSLKGRWESLPLILPEKGLARKRIDSYLQKASISSPHIYAEADGNEPILAMVSLGFGLGLVPSLVRENSVYLDKIRVLEGAPALAPYKVGLCIRKKVESIPTIKGFLSLVEVING